VRIAIDATSLLLRSAGVKNYAWHWIRALRRAAPEHDIQAFPFIGALPPLDHEHSILPFRATAPRLGLLYLSNIFGSALLDPLLAGADVFHASNQVRRPPRRPRLTATVHDLTAWLMPEFHIAANVRADRDFADRVLRRAARLIAVSENTRRDAVRILGIDPARIEMIYSGVAERFFNAVPPAVARPYALFVGTIEPRKNVDALLDAWAALKPSLRDEFELRIVGPPGWNAEATLGRLQAGAQGVRYLGYVAENDLPALTAGAALFVYPSLYEGFGFPVAQAMAAGVAVITSQTSCLPEVAGSGAVFVDPKSLADLTAALDRLLTSPATRATLAQAGRQRAEAEFRWETTARRAIAFFERACK
jgi:glycosyltransferase involved in cell wall biosynthesis